MPTSVEIPDGFNVTQGTKGDSAATDSTSSWSQIALLKGLYAKLAGALTISGFPALGQATKANSLPVTLASDQGQAVNTGTPAETTVSVGVSSTAVLNANASRKFLLLINDSPNTMFVTFSGTNAALDTGVRLNANGGSILWDRYVPTAAVKAIASAASSNLLVEEG